MKDKSIGLAAILTALLGLTSCAGNRSGTSASAQPTPAVCLLDPSVAGIARAVNDLTLSTVTVRVPGRAWQTVLPSTYADRSYAYTNPTLSPDARTLVIGAALQAADGSWQGGLWRFDLATSTPALLLPSDQHSFDFDDPAFSPDASRIAFTRVTYTPRPEHGHNTAFELWLVNADGSNAVRVTGGRTPRWSSDGRYISFDSQTVAGPPLERDVIDAQTFAPVQGLELSACENYNSTEE